MIALVQLQIAAFAILYSFSSVLNLHNNINIILLTSEKPLSNKLPQQQLSSAESSRSLAR